MKKKASGKIRLKLPKKKRFGRFFLRRLLICMLAAMCIGAAAMQSRYRKNAEEFDDRCQESWTRKLESLTSDEGEKEKGKTKAERIIEARDAQYLVNALATGSVGLFGFTPDPFIDCAAVLIHSQKLEYFISEPMVGTYLYTYGNTRHPKLKEQIYLEPEMSEQILGDLLEVSRASNSRQWASLLLDYFGLYRFMDQCAPLREYLRNTYYDDIMLRISADAENRVRKAVVGLMNADGEIFRVFSYGTEEAGECTEYTSDDYVLKDGAYQETDASKPPEGDYLSGMFCIGYPSASKCGRFVRDLVEDEGAGNDLAEEVVTVGFHAVGHEETFDDGEDVGVADALDGAAVTEHFLAGELADGFEIALFFGFVQAFFEGAAAVGGRFLAVADGEDDGGFSEEHGEHDAAEGGAAKQQVLLVPDDVGHIFHVEDEGEAETVVFAHAGESVPDGGLSIA